MNEPLVSIIIPFYSGVEWLEEALTSVQNQTYKIFEVLIINDGSKENIRDIVDNFNLNITIIDKENGGPASARNMGIESASGKYVAFLDSDDLWLPDKLKKQISEMELNEYVWSQHSYEMFWENSNKRKVIDTKIYSGEVFKDCYISFKIQTSCVVVLKSILIENNIRFQLNKRFGQDGDFYRQIAKKYPLAYIEGVYSRFRIRGSNAGFRAKVQMSDRATTWDEIENDKHLINTLPNMVIFAYKLSSMMNKFINIVAEKFIKNNEKNIELISKILYLFPYTIFKIYSRRQV